MGYNLVWMTDAGHETSVVSSHSTEEEAWEAFQALAGHAVGNRDCKVYGKAAEGGVTRALHYHVHNKNYVRGLTPYWTAGTLRVVSGV